MPTLRLLLLLLLAAPLGVLGDAAAGAAVLLVLALLVAAAVDYLLAGDVRRLVVKRQVEEKPSLGAWNPVRLEVENGTRRTLTVEIRDVPSSAFAADPAPVLLRLDHLAPREARIVSYRVLPRRRGNESFADLHVRIVGPLGLMHRQRRLRGTAQAVRVYPNLRDLRRYDLLARRGLLAEAGARAVRVPGASTEFERIREYLPDDEFRRINWKATARRGTPVVNEFQVERSQNLVLMLDAGRLMAARADLPSGEEADALTADELVPGLSKFDHALNAALLLAYVASVRGDRAALLTYGDRVRHFIPPGRGRATFLSMVQATYSLEPEPIEADHGEAFAFLAARNLRRSLVVLFTDLADRESSTTLVGHLMRAARHHLVVCVTLRDPTVVAPAQAHPRDTQMLYEKMVAQRLLDERAGVLATLTQHGVYTLDVDAHQLSPRLVNTYLELKQRGRI